MNNRHVELFKRHERNSDLWELEYLIKNFEFNVCCYCMHRYDSYTHFVA